MALPSDIPPEALPILEEMGYMNADTLHVGDRVPHLVLTSLETGLPVAIGGEGADLPTVLIFGSYT